MPDYQLFGQVLRSELVLPELTRATAVAPMWTLTRHLDSPPAGPFRTLGREDVQTDVSVELQAAGNSLRLVFDDTGLFDISMDGRRIRWHAPAQADLEAVRKDLLGRVFALCLQQQGVMALHGSAVALDGTAVAFLAPKYHGKSTAAAALIETGATLLADDLVAVTAGARAEVLPSVPVVQLWRDSADRMARAAQSTHARLSASALPKQQLALRSAGLPVPLAGIYLLAPVRADAASTLRRRRLGGVEASLALLGQAKIGALIGIERRSLLLAHLSQLAEQVPVYRLEVPRDFGRLSELTSAMWRWHEKARERNSVA
jgi:hypothetical protein